MFRLLHCVTLYITIMNCLSIDLHGKWSKLCSNPHFLISRPGVFKARESMGVFVTLLCFILFFLTRGNESLGRVGDA